MKKGTEIVKFQGDAIEAIREGADVWVSVSRVSDALGLASRAQRRRLAGKEWATCRTMMVQQPGETQARDVFMLHLDAVPMWLATIEASRVRPDVRGKLARYQIECARVLRDHFFGARVETAAPHPVAVIAAAVRDDAALLRDLRRLIGACARQTATTERRIRGWLVRVSGAASYLRMPAAHGAILREQLMRVALGEDVAPWTRRALPSAGAGQQVFPPPLGPARA